MARYFVLWTRNFQLGSFGSELCLLSECNKLISLFPELEKVKAENTDWLTKLFNENDLHLTSFDKKLLQKSFARGFNYPFFQVA